MENPAKNWKANMLAALALTVPGNAVDNKDSLPDPSREVVSVHDFDVPFGEHKHDNFLNAISHLESSGGKFTNHIPSNDSLHQGSTAIGNFALMPKTIKNIHGMLSNPQSKLMQRLGPHYKDEEFSKVASMPEDKMQIALKKNPKIQHRAARYLAEHLMPNGEGDARRAAFKWRFGTNIPNENISDKKLSDSGYVKKFKQFYDQGRNPAVIDNADSK